MDKIKTSVQNAKSHTLWKKRMESGKPREGDYNFVIWQNEQETIIEPWNKDLPPSIFKNGEWIALVENFREDNDVR